MKFLEKKRLLKKQELLTNIITGFSRSFPFLYELSMAINFNLIPKAECVYKGPNTFIIYYGLLDVDKAKTEGKYEIYIDYQISDKLFYMTVLHEIGHLVDLIAGDYKYFMTSKIPNFDKTMKREAEFVNDVDYSLQEFFAESFAYIISKNTGSFGLIETTKEFKNIISIAEQNYNKKKRTT